MNRLLSFAILVAFSAATFAADSEETSDNESVSIRIPFLHSKAKMASMAKITAKDAIDIALEAAAGIPTEVELDVEDGILVYEVEIAHQDESQTEVVIDAGTGRVIEIEMENDD